MRQPILILDFGSQFTQLIARRVRQAQVFSAVLPYTASLEEIRSMHPAGLILSGGPANVDMAQAPACDPGIFSLGLPVLGICYGMQWMTSSLGGQVSRASKGEYGLSEVSLDTTARLFEGLAAAAPVWMSHSYQVDRLPQGFTATASTATCPIAAMEAPARGFYGLQFHPEVTHTHQGVDIIRRFALDICQATQDWRMDSFADQAIVDIREAVGQGTVLLGLSGGVDSAVVAALISKAIGDRLHCVFVDHGFMRQDEPRLVADTFSAHFPVRLIAVDAASRFFDKLKGVSDPERKRKIIGAEFVQVFREEAAKLGAMDHFAQGTIYPDVIESGALPGSVTIKSHHNVGGLPRELGFTSLIEPLRTLFKDEVRQLGRVLGLPRELTDRQPFPGPGLAIRTLGELTPEKVALTRKSDAILLQEFEKAGLDSQVGQFFAVNTNLRSVGVMGDARSYDTAIAIRAVTTDDFMTADWARIPYDTLALISRRIVNEVPGVNRVLLDITTKPPASIEWE